ncbi:MAG: hypothetical protein IT160_04830 [Bryobacterales bacterium]|nr:hypothetical protein [Bryobacterales bacterium]
MEPRLEIAREDLERRFYQLSRQLHPDRFARRPAVERQYSLDAAAILNDAYRVLRDPARRAEYLLNEVPAAAGDRPPVPAELLEEIFEMNMAIESLRGGDQGARPQLAAAQERFLSMRREAGQALEELFDEFDRTHDDAVCSRIRLLLGRRRFIENLIRDVEKELAR